MDRETEHWLDRITAEPDEPGLRVVFVDWLRERGRDTIAEWMQLEQTHHDGELAPELRSRFQRYASSLAAPIRARLARVDVENCTSQVPLQPPPAPTPVWPRDLAAPPGTVVPPEFLETERSPEPPAVAPADEPEPPRLSWWRRLWSR